jgi:hypothetical protein
VRRKCRFPKDAQPPLPTHPTGAHSPESRGGSRRG